MTNLLPATKERTSVTAESKPLPGSLLAYLALTRLYTVVPLALLSYGIGIARGVSRGHVIAAAAAIACALAGGYAYNDLRDQVTDRLNRPARPLVSGQLSRGEVQRFIALLFGAAALLAISTASLRTMTFIILLVLSSQLYSDAIKYIVGLKNMFVGLWCGLLPWGASLDNVVVTDLAAMALVAIFVTQKELIADIYDRDGDAAAGIRTIPVTIGPRAALALVVALNVLLCVPVRSAGDVRILPHLGSTALMVAIVNMLVLCVVLLNTTHKTVRIYLDLQKVFMIGGCIGLFVMASA